MKEMNIMLIAANKCHRNACILGWKVDKVLPLYIYCLLSTTFANISSSDSCIVNGYQTLVCKLISLFPVYNYY